MSNEVDRFFFSTYQHLFHGLLASWLHLRNLLSDSLTYCFWEIHLIDLAASRIFFWSGVSAALCK